MVDARSPLAQFLVSEKDTRPFDDTLRRTMLTPFAQSGYNNSPTYAAPSVLMDIYNAATLPKRVYDGKTAPNDIGENLNFTMNMMGGGTAFGRPTNSLGSGGIRAYHGSPHDFDRFDLSKVGSGEGAQTYGRGLYFAEEPNVAMTYREQLSEGLKTKSLADGSPFDPTRPDHIAGDVLSRSGSREAAIKQLEIQIHALKHYRNNQYISAEANARHRSAAQARAIPLEQALAHVVAETAAPVANKGRLYEVKINAEPEQFIDWDKPLSAQSEAVANAVDAVMKSVLDGAQVAKDNLMPGRLFDIAGRGVAEDLFKQSGVVGVRYLDQMSRTSGDGTRNYVVFDDSLVEILRKYGLIGGAVGLGATSQQGDY